MSHLRVATDEDRRPFFTVQGLADYLNMGRRTVARMLAEGEIPSYKMLGTRRIDAKDVDAWVARHRQDRAA